MAMLTGGGKGGTVYSFTINQILILHFTDIEKSIFHFTREGRGTGLFTVLQ